MAFDAIHKYQCTQHFYEGYDTSTTIIHQQVYHSLFWQHTYIQPHIYQASQPCLTNTASWKLLYLYKKCSFAQASITLLSIIILDQRISTSPTKIGVILDWLAPTNVHKTCSFHRLALFYRCCIQNFNNIMTPIINCTKIDMFLWTTAIEKAFQLIKK